MTNDGYAHNEDEKKGVDATTTGTGTERLPIHVIGRMPIAYRGKDERVERVLMYYCTSSLLALVQDAAEEPSTYCFAETLETKRDALSARRGSCQKSKNPIPTPSALFPDRNPL